MTAFATPSLPPAEAARLTRRVTQMSLGVAAVLTLAKAGAWAASGSVAMLASLADSALDLAASAVTFVAVRYAAAPPDRKYSFGHGKAEAFASLMQAGLVFASAALIGREALARLADPRPVAQEGWAMAVMVFSTLLTVWLVRAQGRVVRQTSSVAVSGDRAHYLSDLASNLIALAGIAAAAFLDLGGVDAVAGLAVAALLVWSAVEVFRGAAAQLMDRELPEDARRRIRALVAEDRRLTHVHQLRTRASGPFVHIQMHLDLDPDLTLTQAHEVIVAAEKRLLAEFPSADIIIHADPRGRAEPHGGAFAENGAERA